MDKANEILKVQQLLKIPVSDLVFNATYADVISENLNVGGIPFYNVAGILSYETGEGVVNWLKWSDLYVHNKSQIDKEIISLVGTGEIVIQVGTFRNLYVRNEKGDLISFVNCSFENGWKVSKQ